MADILIRPLVPTDWPRVREIYDEGIATGYATFETSAPDWGQWDAGHLEAGRLVAQDMGSGRVLGWAAMSPVSDRCVYGGVGEVSVYVAAEAQGCGLGTRLLDGLVHASEEAGYWTLQAGIFPENQASVRIHAKCGFRSIGVRERLGKLNGTWRDVVLMERRSQAVGTD
jgi:L-amino acid N-acyltransferase YncA